MAPNKLKVVIYLFALSFFASLPLNAQLKDNSNQCDYLIIAPAQLANSLQNFINWREQKGLNVELVELGNIYSEFSDSTQSSSIRDFISYALTYWSDPKPKYLLLVGGISLLPSNRLKSKYAYIPDLHEDSVSIDELYSINQYENDSKPDIALGRFPVNNKEELNNVIAKTVNVEDSLSFEDYPTAFTFLTDRTDSIYFEEVANNFINKYLPDNFSIQTIFAGQDSSVEISKNHLLAGLSNGTLFLSYYGHGAPYKWSRYDLFTLDDVDSIRSNNLPFIYTAAACSQSFDLPDDSSIVKKLIVHPRNGTVASIAATGVTYITSGTDFLSVFYNNLFNNPNISIGDAFLKTKRSGDYLIDDIRRRYTLLGDPALKLPKPLIANVENKPYDIPNSFSLEQNYPNPFNPSTKIKYSIPNVETLHATSLQKHVLLVVYDMLGREIATLVNENKLPGEYEVEFDGTGLPSGVYFYRLQSGNFVMTKKLMLLK